jgi:hypothetical protein
LEISGLLKLAKILQKKFGNKFWSKTHVFGSKNTVFEAKTGVVGFQKFQAYKIFGICSIPNFPKITKKMTKKIELHKSQKTRSNSNPDSNI